ncbi:MAG: helix-turn-helix domain-containing protein [Bacillota bacterium]
MQEPRFSLSEIFTASTGARYIGIPYSTLKDDLSRYNKFEEQIERGLVKKEGRVWMITKQALEEVYRPD